MGNPLDHEEFRRQGHIMIDFIADYYKEIEKYPVLSQVNPGYLTKRLPKSAPNSPEPIETILKDVQDHIIPGLIHWQSPRFFGYFPINASIAGFLGEMLATGFNVVPFSWISSPAATELESIVTDWLGQMLKLPNSFLFSGTGGGVLHGTTCEAILCTLVAARDQMLSKIGRNDIQKLVVYCSDQTHSAFQKGSKIAGIDPMNCRVIKTTRSTSFALSPELLRHTICSDIEAGLVPLYLCATVGTTSTTAVDPVEELCDVARDYGMWVHVDAAYAGSACICPKFRHFINGVEGANSFSFNPHKWLLTNLECCCLWVKDPNALIKSLSTDPEYLRNKVTDSRQVVAYKDWQISLTRKFRAMKLWMVLRSYGVERLRDLLRSHVRMAQLFEGFIAEGDMFEIVVPRNFSTVCFRISPLAIRRNKKILENGNGKSSNGTDLLGEKGINEVNSKLLESINESGSVYMTHTVVDGMFVLRCAIGATLTEESHIATAWKVVKEHADAIINLVHEIS